jgi:hypothetical protein
MGAALVINSQAVPVPSAVALASIAIALFIAASVKKRSFFTDRRKSIARAARYDYS